MTLSELRRIADAGFRLPTFARLSRYLNDTRRRGEIPDAESGVLRLLTWAEPDPYRELLRWELPAPDPVSMASSQIGHASAFRTVDNGLSMEYSSRTLSPMMAQDSGDGGHFNS